MWAPIAWWIFWRVTLADWFPLSPQSNDTPKIIKKA